METTFNIFNLHLLVAFVIWNFYPKSVDGPASFRFKPVNDLLEKPSKTEKISHFYIIKAKVQEFNSTKTRQGVLLVGDLSTAWPSVRNEVTDRVEFSTKIANKSRTDYKIFKKGHGHSTTRKLLNLVVLSPVWGEWTPWSQCSVVCGKGGFTVRRRKCESLPDNPCEDMSFDVKSCNSGIMCQAHFTKWGVWGPCSVTCGEGIRARHRVCVTEDKDLKCKGLSSLLERCINPACATSSIAAPESKVMPVAMTYYESSNFEKILHVAAPSPPLDAGKKYLGKHSLASHPFVWGTWGKWSRCSSSCREGYRVRKRFCVDISQDTPVKVRPKWCGVGVASQIVGCIGPCHNDTPFTGDGRVRVVETGSEGGPEVVGHQALDKVQTISQAAVVETGGLLGPKVITGHDTGKNDKASLIVVVQRGMSGPIETSEPETRTSKTTELEDTNEETKTEEGKLTAETILLLVMFVLCIALLIAAICIYLFQKIKENRTLKKMEKTLPFYKQKEEDEDRAKPGVIRPVDKPQASKGGPFLKSLHKKNKRNSGKRKKKKLSSLL